MMHKVVVWGQPHEVELYQRSKSVWIASGTYMGESLEVKRPTKGAALKGWKDAATYKGN